MLNERKKIYAEKGLCLLSVGCLFVFFFSGVPRLISKANSLKCNFEKCQSSCLDIDKNLDVESTLLNNNSIVIVSSNKELKAESYNLFQIISRYQNLYEIRGSPSTLV